MLMTPGEFPGRMIPPFVTLPTIVPEPDKLPFELRFNSSTASVSSGTSLIES